MQPSEIPKMSESLGRVNKLLFGTTETEYTNLTQQERTIHIFILEEQI